MSDNDETPHHPYWCNDCGAKTPFTIRGCPIDHERDCPRFGEDPEAVHASAVRYVRETGKAIA